MHFAANYLHENFLDFYDEITLDFDDYLLVPKVYYKQRWRMTPTRTGRMPVGSRKVALMLPFRSGMEKQIPFVNFVG